MLKDKSEEPIFQVCKDKRKSDYVITIPELMDKSIPQVVMTVYMSFAYSNTISKLLIPSKIVRENRISLNNLIDGITQIYPLENHSISYSTNNNDEDNIYIFCGVYPLDCNMLCELTPSKILYIRLRPHMNTNHLLRLELYEDETENQDETKKKNHYVNEKSKRAKERNIEEIIKKVYTWKKLYEGITDRNGKEIRLTLQDAAEKVDISKKSLDEYYNQLKFGKMFGFDFNKYKKAKVGVLRGFVKKQMETLHPDRKDLNMHSKKKMKKSNKILKP